MTIKEMWEQNELKETQHSREQIERLKNIDDIEITLTFTIDDNTIKNLITYFEYFKYEKELTLEDIATDGFSLLAEHYGDKAADAKWNDEQYRRELAELNEALKNGEIDEDDYIQGHDWLDMKYYQ